MATLLYGSLGFKFGPTFLFCQHLQHFEIFFTGSLHDIIGEHGRGRLLVPVKGKEIIPDELLVKAFLNNPFPVVILRPEAGRVRRKHFIDQDDLTV